MSSFRYFFKLDFCKKSDEEELKGEKDDELIKLMKNKYESLGPFK